MSRPSKQTVNCPKCGKPIEFTLWQSINTYMEFAVPDIISGKLFEVECKSCGLKTRVNYPILFNDMNHNIMIQYCMPDDIDNAVEASRILENAGCRIRIVTSQEELREKTAIFNAGYDDRIIELLKVFVISSLEKELVGENIEAAFFHIDENNLKLELVIDGKVAYVDVNADEISKVEKTFQDKLAAIGDSAAIIDCKWALVFLNRML